MSPGRKKADRATNQKPGPITLAVDIGGTGIKAQKLDRLGKPVSDRTRLLTPAKATPKKVLAIIGKLAAMQGEFDRVSVGFPGVVKEGVVYTAPNLGGGWRNFPLQAELAKRLKRPVRVANDADIQGLGAASGHGVELVITLGTGFGSVIFVDGRRIHLELGHHPFHKGKTYEDELGVRALKKKGKKKWNKLLGEALEDLQRTFNFDSMYIGGGNAKAITLKLPPNVKIVSNEEGLLGGIKLWRDSVR
jgi:polyphosphate glucokinase